MRKRCMHVVLASLSGIVALACPAAALADVRSTPHNMMRGSAFGASSGDSGEVCVFCHTPMIGDAAVGHLPRPASCA